MTSSVRIHPVLPHRRSAALATVAIAAASLQLLSGCSSNDSADGYDADSGVAVTVSAVAPNAVSAWSEVAAATVNGTGSASATSEEQRSNYVLDMATVHVAIYDALMAITGTHRPFASQPQPAQTGASQDAAVAAAALRVLQVLFPNRTALYQAAYDNAVGAIPPSDAKVRGLGIGTAAANTVLSLRLNDGRSVVLPTFVNGTAPGQFRTANAAGLANYYLPAVRPFVMQSAAQFRPSAPPSMSTSAYETAFNETKALGANTSTTRSAAQTDTARFHTEPPPRFGTRNMLPFASHQRNLGDAARLMAMLWVAQADATIACFEAKYFYNAWRPTTAIALADSDGNNNTAPDTTWTPVVPTPNHPEYPAAHACYAGALAEVVRVFYGTRQVTFTLDSLAAGVSSPRHTFASTTAMVEELQQARIWGGMHFRYSSEAGAELGKSVAKLVLTERFQPQ